MSLFVDRVDAGHRPARAVAAWSAHAPVVVGIAHGGVPVAAEVARGLRAPLDVVDVARFGAPDRPFETADAVAEGGVRVLDAARLGLRPAEVAPAMDATARRVVAWRETVPSEARRHAWWGRTVLLVDGGMATGSTAHACPADGSGATSSRTWCRSRVSRRPCDAADDASAVAGSNRAAKSGPCSLFPHLVSWWSGDGGRDRPSRRGGSHRTASTALSGSARGGEIPPAPPCPDRSPGGPRPFGGGSATARVRR